MQTPPFLPLLCPQEMPLGYHQKRVIEFGEFLTCEVLEPVPHRQYVFSIPKRLRIFFMFDRRLLPGLSKCAWRALSAYLQSAVVYPDARPGAIIAVQTFGDFLNFNPHLHIIATDGCFYNNGAFMAVPFPDAKILENLFRIEVFKFLKNEGKITDFVIENMLAWHHLRFQHPLWRTDLAQSKRWPGTSGALYHQKPHFPVNAWYIFHRKI